MFRGSYTAGSVAFLLLSTTLPAFCLRIFPRNARKRRGGSFALGALFQALTQNLARGLLVSPACAGKSSTRELLLIVSRDHPRVCGEKIVAGVVALGAALFAKGSPPRMRGKGHLTLAVSHMHRINPAYAGKRSCSAARKTERGDHPRACGEKTKEIP